MLMGISMSERGSESSWLTVPDKTGFSGTIFLLQEMNPIKNIASSQKKGTVVFRICIIRR